MRLSQEEYECKATPINIYCHSKLLDYVGMSDQ